MPRRKTIQNESARNSARSIDKAEEAQLRILRAAIHEFSEHGLAGARTDAIAAAAKVNKALLYYYFKSKNNLYVAALEDVAGKVMESTLAVLRSPGSAGERTLRAALNHFDRILTQSQFQSLLQQEMMRFRQEKSNEIPVLAKKVFGPLVQKIQEVIQEGIRSGELCDVDPKQIEYSAFGANVFYFLSAPMMRIIGSFDPFELSALEFRRRAAVEFLGQALFIDRRRGAKLAKRVLADTPMPEMKKFPGWRKKL
jgi:TetR/AcrR family transcriptional regulator